jgi:hypothetical protein
VTARRCKSFCPCRATRLCRDAQPLVQRPDGQCGAASATRRAAHTHARPCRWLQPPQIAAPAAQLASTTRARRRLPRQPGSAHWALRTPHIARAAGAWLRARPQRRRHMGDVTQWSVRAHADILLGRLMKAGDGAPAAAPPHPDTRGCMQILAAAHLGLHGELTMQVNRSQCHRGQPVRMVLVRCFTVYNNQKPARTGRTCKRAGERTPPHGRMRVRHEAEQACGAAAAASANELLRCTPSGAALVAGRSSDEARSASATRCCRACDGMLLRSAQQLRSHAVSTRRGGVLAFHSLEVGGWQPCTAASISTNGVISVPSVASEAAYQYQPHQPTAPVRAQAALSKPDASCLPNASVICSPNICVILSPN